LYEWTEGFVITSELMLVVFLFCYCFL